MFAIRIGTDPTAHEYHLVDMTAEYAEGRKPGELIGELARNLAREWNLPLTAAQWCEVKGEWDPADAHKWEPVK